MKKALIREPRFFKESTYSNKEIDLFQNPALLAANAHVTPPASLSPSFPASNPFSPSGKTKTKQPQPTKLHRFFKSLGLDHHNWLLEEFSFSMNKISLAGLIFGLMVLGSLFFVIGFLAAIATFGTNNSAAPTTWASANTASTNSQPSALGRVASSIGGSIVRDKVARLESHLGGGALSSVVTKVPPSLQPFAAQAQNQLAIKSQQRINNVAESGIAGAFSPSSFGRAQNRPSRQQDIQQQPAAPNAPLLRRPPAPIFAPKNPQQQAGQQPQYRRVYPPPAPQVQQPPALQYYQQQPQPGAAGQPVYPERRY